MRDAVLGGSSWRLSLASFAISVAVSRLDSIWSGCGCCLTLFVPTTTSGVDLNWLNDESQRVRHRSGGIAASLIRCWGCLTRIFTTLGLLAHCPR